MARLLLTLLGLAIMAARCVITAEDESSDDTVGIGLIDRPKYCDKKSKKGDLVKITFNVTTGFEGEGVPFDNRYENDPVEFVLGDHTMIKGLEAGLEDMCVGEIRFISVPQKYAYRDNGIGALPSRVTMHFNVKMVAFEALPERDHEPVNIFKMIDRNGDNKLDVAEIKIYLTKEGVKDIPGDQGLSQIVRDIMREEDRNQDVVISKEEFSGVKEGL